MILGRYRYIVVEGPVGAGKTDLARRLADHFRAGTLLETPEENPFLAKFYQDPARHALAAQLFFLFQRSAQLRGLSQMDMFSQATVSDFIFDKDLLFAQLTLNDDEFRLYQQIYAHLEPQTLAPDLVIYLQAPVHVLAERVRRRGVAYERHLSDEYLARVADSYSRFFYQYNESPILIVNSEHMDLAGEQQDFELLLARISDMRGPREFFNRAA